MYLVKNSKRGITIVQLAEQLKITVKTAWFLANRIRTMFVEDGIILSGKLEADETYVGGKYRNKHYDKKKILGRGTVSKFPVFGMQERGGKVVAMHVKNTIKENLHRLIHEHVKEGSILYTAQHRSYEGIDCHYKDRVINHGAWQFADGDITTNAIESSWAVVKRSYSTHYWWSEKHLRRYIAECMYRQNNCEIQEIEAIGRLIKRGEGRRLNYSELCG